MVQGYSAYKKTQISTANKGQLIVLLYETAIKNLYTAVDLMNPKNYDKVNTHILKAQDIITELMVSLDKSAGDLAEKLDSIYNYMNRRLIDANINKDDTIITEVISYLETLLSSWKTIVKQENSISSKNEFAGNLSVEG